MSNNQYQAKGGNSWAGNASGAEELRKHQSYDGSMAGSKAHNPFSAGKSGGGAGGPPVFFRSKTGSS